MITLRQTSILKAIIEGFISSGNPVGSKTIQEQHELPYSSATIRNEMAALETLGLIEKTHTSSGRVPSNQGYQFYDDYLIEDTDIDEITLKRLKKVFDNRRLELDDVVQEACNIIASMTNYTSIALGNRSETEVLQKVDLHTLSNHSVVVLVITESGLVESRIFNVADIEVSDLNKCVKILNKLLYGEKIANIPNRLDNDVREELSRNVANYELFLDAFVNTFIKFASNQFYIGGRSNIINQPDFDDINKIKHIVETLEDQEFFAELAHELSQHSVLIGNVDNALPLEDVTVVSANYHISADEQGVLAIIGPKRMEYSKVIKILEYTSDQISQIFNEQRGESNE